MRCNATLKLNLNQFKCPCAIHYPVTYPLSCHISIILSHIQGPKFASTHAHPEKRYQRLHARTHARAHTHARARTHKQTSRKYKSELLALVSQNVRGERGVGGRDDFQCGRSRSMPDLFRV